MAAPGQQEPTQEEIEAYFAQLREIPAEELVMQAISMLAGGAQAKLGLRDARVLIDSIEALIGVAGDRLGPAAQQISDSVGQLKLAQVQLEKQMAAQDAQPADQAPDQAVAGGQAPSGPAESAGSEKKMTDRLWIPGQ